MYRVKVILLTILVSCSSSILFAQGSKLTSADAYRQEGKLDKAKEAIDQATVHQKTLDNPRTWLYRAQIYNAIGFDQTGLYRELAEKPFEEAMQAIQKCLEYDEKGRYEKRVVRELTIVKDGLFNQGAKAYQEQNFKESHEMFKASYEANKMLNELDQEAPLDTAVLFNVGYTADLSGMNDEAEKVYRELVELQYQDPAVYRRLSNLYIRQEKLEQAEEILTKGREMFPESQDLLIEELNYYLSQGRASEVIGKFEEAIKMDPENPELYFALGTAYNELVNNDPDNVKMHMQGARDAYLAVLELQPKNFSATLNLGALFYNRAIKLNDEIAEVDLDDEETYNRLKAEQTELFEEALPYFEKCREIYLENPEEIEDRIAAQAYQALKEIYALLGDMEKSNEAKAKMEELLGE